MAGCGRERLLRVCPVETQLNIIDHLGASGIGVVRDVALGLEPRNFGQVTPQQWTEIA
jgi:hypothetical protein